VEFWQLLKIYFAIFRVKNPLFLHQNKVVGKKDTIDERGCKVKTLLVENEWTQSKQDIRLCDEWCWRECYCCFRFSFLFYYVVLYSHMPDCVSVTFATI